MIHCVLAAVTLWLSRTTRVPMRAVSCSWWRVSSGLSSTGCAPSRSREVQSGLLRQQAPVVGGADCVHQIQMWAGVGGQIDEAVFVVAARHHRGDAHIEIGVGLALAVHARIAVDQAGDKELAGAIDDLRALGDRHLETGADLDDAPVLHDNDGVLQVIGRVAPVGQVDQRAASQNQQRRAGTFHRRGSRRLIAPGRAGQQAGQQNTANSGRNVLKYAHRNGRSG